jgi:hypothetical protein
MPQSALPRRPDVVPNKSDQDRSRGYNPRASPELRIDLPNMSILCVDVPCDKDYLEPLMLVEI